MKGAAHAKRMEAIQRYTERRPWMSPRSGLGGAWLPGRGKSGGSAEDGWKPRPQAFARKARQQAA